MNCKQGDIAVIVSADTEWDRMDIGKLVHVVEPGDDWSHIDSRFHWAVRSVSGGPLACEDEQTEARGFEAIVDIADECLRPIRDPGEDATDETLVPGYVKHKEHA